MQIRAVDARPEVIGSTVVSALLDAGAELALGALMSLEIDNARLRLLPLTPTR